MATDATLISVQETNSLADRNGAALRSQQRITRAAADPSSQTFDILAVLQRRWPIVGAAVLACWVLAAIYFVVAKPTFQSESQLLVMRKDPSLAAQGVGGSLDAQTSISEDQLATQMQVVQSKRIVSEALALTGLDQLESIVKRVSESRTATDYVCDNLDVTRGGSGQARAAHVLNIAFRHSSPSESKDVLEAIIARYQAFLNEKFQDVNKEATTLIAEARTELSGELAAAEQAYQEYREQAPLLWNGDQSTNVHRDRYEQMQAELSLLCIQVNEAQSRLGIVRRVVQQQNEEGATDLERLVVIDEKNAERVGILLSVQKGEADTAEFQSRQPERMEYARSEYQNLLMLKMKEQELLENLAARHPAVENIRRQIATAKEFIGAKTVILGVSDEDEAISATDLQNAYVKLLERDLDTLLHRQTELGALADVEELQAKELVKYELKGGTLRQRVEVQQALYDAVVGRLREINLAKDYGGMINEVIAPAETGKEVWPSLPICLALGTMMGLVLGGGAATAAEVRDRSFLTPEEISQALDTTVLAHVPSIDVSNNRKLAAALAASGSRVDPLAAAFHIPHSREAEVFRGLRTSVFFRAKETDLKTIAVTSPHQGDGKSTVLLNLAVSIAQAGRSILIVDADMRRPRINDMLGLKGEKGMSHIVSEEAEPWDLIRPTDVENLYALGCGQVPDNPAELLSNPRFGEFLDLARQRYDYVLVDCPPVLAVTDPCIVAPLVDGVLMVIQTAQDSRPQAVSAKEMLDEVGANVFGTVVNQCGTSDRSGYNQFANRYANAYLENARDAVSAS